MTSAARLQRDHDLFRIKLDALECALRMRGDTWFAIREFCVTLGKQLPAHMRREELAANLRELAAVDSKASTGPAAWRTGSLRPHLDDQAASWPTHEEERRELQVLISRFFAQRRDSDSYEALRPALEAMISRFRRQMDAQETGCFAWCSAQELQAPLSEGADALSEPNVKETMTVNHVIDTYPDTKSVFECLFVNLSYEGHDYLDEVAHRRGMEVRDLLHRLEHAVLQHRADPRGALLVN